MEIDGISSGDEATDILSCITFGQGQNETGKASTSKDIPIWRQLPTGRTMTLAGGIVLPFSSKIGGDDDEDDMLDFQSKSMDQHALIGSVFVL